MSGLREQKKQQTRQAILNAAITLFSRNGFERTSIEDIAKAAGIGNSTIYGYFSHKDEIFIHYCDEQLDRSFAGILAEYDIQRPLLEQMLDFFMLQFRFVTENREFGRQMLREMVFPAVVTEQAHQHNQRFLDMLENLLRAAQQRGAYPDRDDLFYDSVHFFSLYLGALAGWYTGYLTDLSDAQEGLRRLFQQALEGLSS